MVVSKLFVGARGVVGVEGVWGAGDNKLEDPFVGGERWFELVTLRVGRLCGLDTDEDEEVRGESEEEEEEEGGGVFGMERGGSPISWLLRAGVAVVDLLEYLRFSEEIFLSKDIPI